MARKRAGLRRLRPRSKPAVRHGDGPPLPSSPSTSAVGHEYVVEEDLGEAVVAVEPRDGTHGDALGVEGDEEVA